MIADVDYSGSNGNPIVNWTPTFIWSSKKLDSICRVPICETGPAGPVLTDELCAPKPSTSKGWHTFFDFGFVEDSIRSQVSWQRRKQLLFSIDQTAGVERCQLEFMTVRNGVGGAGLHAVAAEDTAVVVDVIDLGVSLAAADALLIGVFRGFYVNAIGGRPPRTRSRPRISRDRFHRAAAHARRETAPGT